MNIHFGRHLWLFVVIAVAVSCAAGLARAQQPDPFGRQDPFGQQGQAGQEQPFGQPAATPQPAEKALEAAEPVVAVEENSAVTAVLATNPTTPAELVRAARIMAGLDRPDLAKGMLQKVLDAGLNQDQTADLQEQFGSGLFVEIAGRADLAPEGKQLADLVLAAAANRLRSPERLQDLIGKLGDPSAAVRVGALGQLQLAGDAGVVALIAVLADAGKADRHPAIQAALARMGSDAEGPMAACLESDDAALTVKATAVLSELEPDAGLYCWIALATSEDTAPKVQEAANAALVKLTGKLPQRNEAAMMLARRAKDCFNGRVPIRQDIDGNVEVWSWDAEQGRPVASMLPADEAVLATAARLAAGAHSVEPKNPEIRLLYVATLLEKAALAAGLEQPLEIAEGSPAGIAASFGLEMLEDVLQDGMRSGHLGAAIAAVRILGARGGAEPLVCCGHALTPLVEAACHDDRRLRFAAIEAIMKLKPSKPFAGSSCVAEAIRHLAALHGKPLVLVAGPSTSESQRIGGYLIAMGYEIETARTGRELIRLALASADCEIILADSALEGPTLDLLVQQLRHDNRTAGLPVGILARAGRLAHAERIAKSDPLVEAFPRPHAAATAQWQVEQLAQLPGQAFVDGAERLRQAKTALAWLADMTAPGQRVLQPVRPDETALAALFNPDLAPGAIAVLANVGTPLAQQALADLASRWTQPLATRKAAAEALWENTAQHGILLTTEQILLQYQRYNESEHLDKATQQVQASILNCLEAPTEVLR